MVTSFPTPSRCPIHHGHASLCPPPYLSAHLLCGEGPPDHEVPATHVRDVYVPVSADPRDGCRDALLPVCPNPACHAASHRSARCHVDDDRHIGHIRPLTVADTVWFGVELTGGPHPYAHVAVQAGWYGRWDVLVRDGDPVDGGRIVASWRHEHSQDAVAHAALLRGHTVVGAAA